VLKTTVREQISTVKKTNTQKMLKQIYRWKRMPMYTN